MERRGVLCLQKLFYTRCISP